MSNKVEVSEFQAAVAEMPGSAAGAQDESAPDAKVRSMPLGHVIVQDHALRDSYSQRVGQPSCCRLSASGLTQMLLGCKS